MKLIECRDCKKQVSDEATNCPACGCPVEPPQPPLASIFDFCHYRVQHVVSWAAFLVAIFGAYWSLDYFLSSDFPKTRDTFIASTKCRFILFGWALGPPAWFFFENYVLWMGADDAQRERLTTGRELAEPFWAAVLVTLVFLIPDS